ncbi:16S rRNA (cytidine(1402)-2'-O)-methyltransferase [candidate division WWE3 bacterium RIFCSPHIGHO2_12_FULL_38_15]|uniref:Ribosomal RNA small subunit methyltransferase I n=1 Tax=candidate division WWE3 bacterium RIFCSPHIGHO2_02_FULL_38_14 TaxID=1802620 RepID=A0A1F4V7Q7_UNCKA|nr:MAG: 16S rRNA (cytidine(1402)-2'-O)-methyltransferase [candidate division WWE3 bacterium RIFCSPHIGHO2_01_FULL_38_45]OGC48926.1 MAG: 16S rRNA (cytidine(1402)-2'-O)-methyltransferase [candidate division WWE3 bacterium RIFCSPHIGHO2_12_FULL_38_15]OGC52967.1 MAG: 16S rRNA (cytidine(1402)-2'-O)-methyltransferase [candidate division WWE3 bacterium RIFCSPLOWO2_01_FULL_37_24]OGC53232.1 MAG: 16S rRNA (cytidine(1402)-2'-O)-methyltransferase [candidate division WWE3 bacterium RIFCSPHIGHO2_02_FULL_38_14]
MATGSLFIISGPIGNLEDITLRAISTLKTLDYLLSEDTRETDKILSKFGLKIPQISYRDEIHLKIYPKVVEMLENGKNIGFMTDSGTPLISDPGYKLVYQLRNSSYKIVSIPGPSSVVAALSISGLPSDKFIFIGFLPKKENQRKEILFKYGALDATLTIFESPYRIVRLISEVKETLGNRRICVVKDLTKAFETVLTGKIIDIENELKILPQKGEYILLIAKEDIKVNRKA